MVSRPKKGGLEAEGPRVLEDLQSVGGCLVEIT
jgi:hypothetical protein